MRVCSPVVLSYSDAGLEPRCRRKDFLTACCCCLLAACCLLKCVAHHWTLRRGVKPRQGKPSSVIRLHTHHSTSPHTAHIDLYKSNSPHIPPPHLQSTRFPHTSLHHPTTCSTCNPTALTPAPPPPPPPPRSDGSPYLTILHHTPQHYTEHRRVYILRVTSSIVCPAYYWVSSDLSSFSATESSNSRIQL